MSSAVKRLLAILAERFPEAFAIDPKAVRPLKVGIHEDLAAMLPEVDAKHLRQALAYHTRRPGYLRALTRGGSQWKRSPPRPRRTP